MLSAITRAAVVMIGWLIVADIAGVVVCTVFDILPLRWVSVPLFYAVWLVAGAFAGLFAFDMAGSWASPGGGDGDWSAGAGAGRLGTIVLLTGAAVIAALVAALYRFYWGSGGGSGIYVPDSKSYSLTFFIAALGGLAVGRFTMPAPGGDAA